MKLHMIIIGLLLLASHGFSQEIVIEDDTPIQQDRSGTGLFARIRDTMSSGISGDGALLLISGGLFILLFLVPTSMLHAFFMKQRMQGIDLKKNMGTGTTTARMYNIGFSTGRSLKVSHVDDVIEAFNYLENTQVSVVNNTTKLRRLRVKSCRSCEGKRSKKPVCEFERGFFAGAFESIDDKVEVKESKCRAEGGGYCEFEIHIR